MKRKLHLLLTFTNLENSLDFNLDHQMSKIQKIEMVELTPNFNSVNLTHVKI